MELLCAYLCVTELPGVDYTRQISILGVGSNPSDARFLIRLRDYVGRCLVVPKLLGISPPPLLESRSCHL
jgi:hypothetical protein